ncbi:MAG: phosphoglycerate dehydrogenase [Cyanobacteriota bacterium]|jgi:D-3-phosphoglycerate dehydrogenase
MTAMALKQVLVTCPPMLGMFEDFLEPARALGMQLVAAKVTQTLSETELMACLPEFDGWIIGDDPATGKVFEAGQKGRLSAAVKWGVGIDNVDFSACKRLGIPISNTPGMFGHEVADVALGYVICLARHMLEIDRGVRNGTWPKPRGISLAGRTAAVVGYGDIGRQTARRLRASEMNVVAYDPFVSPEGLTKEIRLLTWPSGLELADFLIVNCALTPSSFHLVNREAFAVMKPGIRIVNVGRGAVIDEQALHEALLTGQVHSAALDVFEEEPLPKHSPLREHPRCILGSHNASNTEDAVERTSQQALNLLANFLKEVRP